MAWLRTAFLAGYVHWDALDANSARATVSLPLVSVAGIVHVDEQGRRTHFTTERYRLEHKQQVLRPWIGHYDDYREKSGLRIPMKAEVAYTLEARVIGYFRSEVTQIDYDHSKPY